MIKKLCIFFLFFICSLLYANDYIFDLANALIRNDYPVIENIITRNINTAPVSERNLIMNHTVTYSHGETTLRVLLLLQRYNVYPGAYELFTAINRNQSNAVIQYIIDSGVRANGEILLVTMEKQRFDFARQFILAGVDVNYQYPLSRNYSDGMTPLLHAARNNDFELVQMLVERGADINAVNRNGNTALSIARMNGNTQISDFLIDMGASQYVANPVQDQMRQSTGIAGLFDTLTIEFQPGNYRLSGGVRDLRFSGTANYGNVSMINNNRLITGIYQVNNGSMTLILDGRSFIYRVDSGVSFSGNGETWTRTGN